MIFTADDDVIRLSPYNYEKQIEDRFIMLSLMIKINFSDYDQWNVVLLHFIIIYFVS